MSQQKRLEKVLDLLLSEDSEQASELLHQIIVEKARTIYENIVDEETSSDEDMEEIDEAADEGNDEVGGDPSEDFTAEISSDEDEIDADEENDGEAGSDDDADFGGDEEDMDVEDRVDDLEAQLADLRAEFDALMADEMEEPNHADLAADMADGELGGDMGGMDDMGMGDGSMVKELAFMEKKKQAKLDKAPMAKDKKKDKKVDEETQFQTKVADTGQKSKAGLVGTGKGMTLGAEQNQSPYTHAPSKKDYGGKPVKFGSGTGGEYGKYHGDNAKDDTPSDNVDVEPKKSSIKADTTAKYTGGKAAGEGFNKSPFTKKPA